MGSGLELTFLVQVQGIGLTLYVYQLRKDANGVESVNVEKITYTKVVGGS
jgi:vacuolar protein sorting-associated protein 29